MKDNLFEMLLNLFETSLSQLQKSHNKNDKGLQEDTDTEETLEADDQLLFVRNAQNSSTRIFTYEEQMKLTKASYQFLMRMKLWNIIDDSFFELIISELQCSDSRIVTLEETKWAIRNILENHMNESQLAFLDLVLYQTEDELTLH
jgi:Smg protein